MRYRSACDKPPHRSQVPLARGIVMNQVRLNLETGRGAELFVFDVPGEAS